MTVARRTKTAGLTVNLRVQGNGPPLLFLGGSSFDMSLRAPVFDSDLPSHFTVAAADPRGLGLTDAPEGTWTMRDYAEDAVHILDALGWDRADILGESFGAMTALHLAALSPHRINRMALSAGSAGGKGGQSYPIHDLRQISDARSRAQRALEIMDSRFSQMLKCDKDAAEAMIDDRVESEARFISSHDNATGYPRLLAARAGHDVWDQLPGITVPTLVFAGAYDLQAPPDRASSIVTAMPNAELHIFEGGHNICFASPDPVITLIKTWT